MRTSNPYRAAGNPNSDPDPDPDPDPNPNPNPNPRRTLSSRPTSSRRTLRSSRMGSSLPRVATCPRPGGGQRKAHRSRRSRCTGHRPTRSSLPLVATRRAHPHPSQCRRLTLSCQAPPTTGPRSRFSHLGGVEYVYRKDRYRQNFGDILRRNIGRGTALLVRLNT
jgi:hypothetical protein